MDHVHVFDVRDVNETHCLDCNRWVKDPGKIETGPPSNPIELLPFLERLSSLAGSGIQHEVWGGELHAFQLDDNNVRTEVY